MCLSADYRRIHLKGKTRLPLRRQDGIADGGEFGPQSLDVGLARMLEMGADQPQTLAPEIERRSLQTMGGTVCQLGVPGSQGGGQLVRAAVDIGGESGQDFRQLVRLEIGLQLRDHPSIQQRRIPPCGHATATPSTLASAANRLSRVNGLAT